MCLLRVEFYSYAHIIMQMWYPYFQRNQLSPICLQSNSIIAKTCYFFVSFIIRVDKKQLHFLVLHIVQWIFSHENAQKSFKMSTQLLNHTDKSSRQLTLVNAIHSLHMIVGQGELLS